MWAKNMLNLEATIMFCIGITKKLDDDILICEIRNTQINSRVYSCSFKQGQKNRTKWTAIVDFGYRDLFPNPRHYLSLANELMC